MTKNPTVCQVRQVSYVIPFANVLHSVSDLRSVSGICQRAHPIPYLLHLRRAAKSQVWPSLRESQSAVHEMRKSRKRYLNYMQAGGQAAARTWSRTGSWSRIRLQNSCFCSSYELFFSAKWVRRQLACNHRAQRATSWALTVKPTKVSAGSGGVGFVGDFINFALARNKRQRKKKKKPIMIANIYFVYALAQLSWP